MEQKTLSILIPTIAGREKFLNRLLAHLGKQIKEHKLKDKVQILLCKDKPKQHSIGTKRNYLLQNCNGAWAMFIDDDDLINDTALPDIIALLEANNPDVISITGILQENGKPDREFKHSTSYKSITEVRGLLVRPPNHLNPMRTSISKQFIFKEISHGEDSAWCMDICNSTALKSDWVYDKPYYYYMFNPNK